MHNNIEVYKAITIVSDFTLSAIRKADSWFMNKMSEIVQMKYVTATATGIVIHGYPTIDKNNFFNQPVSLSKLNIFMSDGKVESLISCKLSEITAKILCLEFEQNFVFLPLLHTFKKYF